MAHGLSFKEDGTAEMFAVVRDRKDTPWHGLGIQVTEAPDTKTAIRLAGLDWEVGLRSLFTANLDTVTDQPVLADRVNIAQAVYRKDNNKILGVTGMSYIPLQNHEAFSFFDPFLEKKLATLETAGALFDGKRIWILAKINRDPSVIVPKADDIVNKYVLLANAHDGTMGVKVGYTPIRVVCQNTLSMAEHNHSSQLIRIKHSKSVVQNLEDLRDTMNLIDAKFEATAEQFRKLATKQINQEDLKKYVIEVFDLNKDKKEEEIDDIYLTENKDKVEFNEITDRPSRVLNDVTELFESGRGNTLPGVKGTLWAAYNAVTEYTTHYRGRTLENRFNSLMFTDGARINKRALNKALTLTK